MKINVTSETMIGYEVMLKSVQDIQKRNGFDKIITIVESDSTKPYEFTVDVSEDSEIILIPILLNKNYFDLGKLHNVESAKHKTLSNYKIDKSEYEFRNILIRIETYNKIDKTRIAELIHFQFVGYEDYIDSNIFLNYDVDEYINIGVNEQSSMVPLFIASNYYNRGKYIYD